MCSRTRAECGVVGGVLAMTLFEGHLVVGGSVSTAGARTPPLVQVWVREKGKGKGKGRGKAEGERGKGRVRAG